MNIRCNSSVSKTAAVAWSFFLALLCSCHPDDKRADNKPTSGYASLDSSTSYVGMDACRQCHAAIYDSFIRTGMGMSFGRANKTKSAADFSSSAPLYDSYLDFWYHPHWDNEALLFSEIRLNGKDTIHLRTETIDYIVGSGQHTNSHLWQDNGYLFQAPMTFYTQERKWDFPPGFENGHNSRFSRKIEFECMTCHNAYPTVYEGAENKYKKIPLGIDCERCHGPGSKHIALKQQGERVDTSTSIDYSIVNPGKLPIDLQLDVCQRCHVQGNTVLHTGKSFFDFKPAMRLSSVMDVYMPVFKGREDEHIMASHAERMKMSRCFLESKRLADQRGEGDTALRPYRNALTCVTCHNPHISVRETGAATFNTACKKCHSESNKQVMCNASPVARKKSKDDCAGCHMPKNNTIDIPHVVTTDHFIRKPVTAKQKDSIRKFVGLVSINNPRPSDLSKGVAYLNYFEKFVAKKEYLDSARFYLSDRSDADFITNYNALIRWAYLGESYRELLRFVERGKGIVRPVSGTLQEQAWTLYRTGEAHLHSGNLAVSVSYFKAASDLLPFQLDFRLKLADALYSTSSSDAALEQYKFVLAESPKNTQALLNYGYILLAEKNRLAEADSIYSKVLELDPDYVQALVNRAGTQVMMGNRNAGRQFIDRALKLDPANSQALQMKRALGNGEASFR